MGEKVTRKSNQSMLEWPSEGHAVRGFTGGQMLVTC